MKKMIEITEEFVIKALNAASKDLKLEMILFSVALLFLFFFYSIGYLSNKKKDSTRQAIVIVGILTFIFIGTHMLSLLLDYNTINYSIKKNNWIVTTDTVVDNYIIYSNYRGHKVIGCYIVLKEHGKVSVDYATCKLVSKGSEVYVILVKTRFGGIYPTSRIYSKELFVYNE